VFDLITMFFDKSVHDHPRAHCQLLKLYS
jgi:hypothetical protein